MIKVDIPETGIEKMRRMVRLFDRCSESFNDKFTIPELVSIAEACWASKWDIYPDEWEARQIHEAITYCRAPDWKEVKANEWGGTKMVAVYEPVTGRNLVDYLKAQAVTLEGVLSLSEYTEVIEYAREWYGDKVHAFLMDSFMPEGEAVEPGYEDSLSLYRFTPTSWEELEKEWDEA